MTNGAKACLAGALVVMTSGSRWVVAQKDAPSFGRDVAPIFNARCVECHRPGEIAPMSFLTYEEVRPWVRAIRQRVLDRTMPPWLAAPGDHAFANDRRLPQAELDIIIRWIDAGAPKGPAEVESPPPTAADAWRLGVPDAVIEMTEPFEVPAEGTVPMTYFVLPTNLAEDRWLSGVELQAGNRSVVHHILALALSPETERISSMEDVEANFLGGAGPGEHPSMYPPGTGKLLRAGSKIMMQMHYTANGIAARDRSRVGLYFASRPPPRSLQSHFVGNRDFNIPAGHPNYEVSATWTVTEPISLLQIGPHMHLRGKAFTIRLTYPDGRSTVLLDVPRFDFFWQLFYQYETPVAVPPGSRIDAVAHFDNSAANKKNPNPTIDVRWGEQTWDEMMGGWITFTKQAEPRD